jgi:hypothetical protein
MDSILTTLVQLASSLSPTLFLGVLSLMVGSVITTIKVMGYVTNKKKNSKGLLSLLTGQASASITEEMTMLDLQKKLDTLLLTVDTLATLNSAEKTTEGIIAVLADLKRNVLERADMFDKHTDDLSIFKTEIKDGFKGILVEFADVKHSLKMHDVSNHSDVESARELQTRIHGILVRAISQIEKADEFTRTTVPEFRSYHKELSKDLSDLSRDIALVERSIQNQINTSQAIKLR